MIVLIKSILLIFLTNGMLVSYFKKKFEIMIPFTFILFFLILYSFSFIKHISFGYYFLWLVNIVFYLYFFTRTKEKKEFINNYFTIGMVIYLVLFIYIYFLQITRGFNYWDEFGHWGPMVKESYKLDKIYSVYASNLQRHKDYPPFFTLIELLWCYFGRAYSEGYLYVAITSFTISLFMPVFALFDCKKDIVKSITVSISVLLMFITISATVTASDSARLLNSIYIDWPMAIFIAMTMYFILELKNVLLNNVLISSLLISLLMMKQMGMPFYLLCLLLILLKTIFIEHINDKKELIRLLILYVIVPVLFYYGWGMLIKYLGVSDSAQFKIGDIGLDFISIIKGKSGKPYQIESATNFINALTNRSLITHPINLSYFPSVFLLSIGLFFVINENKVRIITTTTYLFGGVSYAFAMLLLYIYSFNYAEGPSLASFDRYMISYLYIGLCLLFMLLIKRWYESKLIYIIPLTIALFIETEDIKELVPVQDRESLFSGNTMAKVLKYDKINEKDKVLVINQVNSDHYYLAVFGYLDGYKNCDVIKLGKSEQENDKARNLTLDEFNNLVNNYDYLYILTTNNELERYFGNVKIDDHSLYKIDKSSKASNLIFIQRLSD